jgi:hypothetical protein
MQLGTQSLFACSGTPSRDEANRESELFSPKVDGHHQTLSTAGARDGSFQRYQQDVRILNEMIFQSLLCEKRICYVRSRWIFHAIPSLFQSPEREKGEYHAKEIFGQMQNCCTFNRPTARKVGITAALDFWPDRQQFFQSPVRKQGCSHLVSRLSVGFWLIFQSPCREPVSFHLAVLSQEGGQMALSIAPTRNTPLLRDIQLYKHGYRADFQSPCREPVSSHIFFSNSPDRGIVLSIAETRASLFPPAYAVCSPEVGDAFNRLYASQPVPTMRCRRSS